MTESKSLFDEAFQTLQHERHRRVPAHALALEAQARLHERLADVKQDFVNHREWRKGVDSSSADLITSCLNLQLRNDIGTELAAIYASLTQGGLFLGCLAGGRTLHELRTCLIEAETTLTKGINPRIAPMLDMETLSKLMLAAGFSLPVVDYERVTLVYKNMYNLMHDLCINGYANALTQRTRHFTQSALFKKANELYLSRFPSLNNGIIATVDLVFLHGWKE